MTKPEALWLADLQEQHYGRETPISAELRRLHSLNEELLAALKGFYNNSIAADWPDGIYDAARAAIAKATGEQTGEQE